MASQMTEQEIQAIVREVTDEEVAFYQEYGWVMMKQLVDPDFSRQLLEVSREWMKGDGSGEKRPHVHLPCRASSHCTPSCSANAWRQTPHGW